MKNFVEKLFRGLARIHSFKSYLYIQVGSDSIDNRNNHRSSFVWYLDTRHHSLTLGNLKRTFFMALSSCLKLRTAPNFGNFSRKFEIILVSLISGLNKGRIVILSDQFAGQLKSLRFKRLDFDVISVSEEERNEPIMFFGRNICDLICVLARKPKFRGRHSDWGQMRLNHLS